MKAIVIKREIDKQELAVVSKMAEGDTDLYSEIPLNPFLDQFNKGSFEITENEKREINYKTMDFLIAYGQQEIDGQTVIDWLGFDKSSIWYYHKFRAYFALRNRKYLLLEIHKLSKLYKEVDIYLSDHLIQDIKLPDNVTLKYSRIQKSTKIKFFPAFNFLIILLSRLFLNITSFSALKRKKHVLIDFSKSSPILDINTLSVYKGNYGIGYLLDAAGKDFLIIDESIQPKFKDNEHIDLTCKNLFGKGKLKDRYFSEPLLINYFLSLTKRRRKKELLRKIDHGLERLMLAAHSTDEKLLVNILKSVRGSTNYHLIKYITYRAFFRGKGIQTITTVDENAPARKAILDAAKYHEIITIGIQHGSIHDLHPGYLFTEADINKSGMPDHTLVWGNYWKEFLVQKGHYNPSSLHICGQIRADVIPKLLKAGIPRSEIIPKVPKNDLLIVFASQPQRDPRLRERAALDVMEAIRDIPNCFLLIKLHPNERYDTGYYHELAKKAGLEKVLITLKIDLYSLISVCDILVTCFSTVGTETIYFRKPLIILDHLKQDIQNYHKEGVALQASNMEELKDHLESILNGASQVDPKAYDKFITKYAFAIDGKAAERALEVIRKLGTTQF